MTTVHSGRQEFELTGPVNVRITHTGPIQVWIKYDNEYQAFMPMPGYKMNFNLTEYAQGYLVDCAKDCHYSIDFAPYNDLKEHPDPTPVEEPVDAAPQSQQELINEQIKQMFARYAEEQGQESPEEADDFDIDDPYDDPLTGYELFAMEMDDLLDYMEERGIEAPTGPPRVEPEKDKQEEDRDDDPSGESDSEQQ